MSIVNDFEMIKQAVHELNKTNIVLQETLAIWSESITSMHKAELDVRSAHRSVVKAQNMLSVAINNNLGPEIEKLKNKNG